MPFIALKMYRGRSEEVKKELAEAARDFIAEKMGMDKKHFIVTIEDIEPEDWQEKVVDQIDPATVYFGKDKM